MVTLRRAGLVLRWVIVLGYILCMYVMSCLAVLDLPLLLFPSSGATTLTDLGDGIDVERE